jgi:hypothetical protein
MADATAVAAEKKKANLAAFFGKNKAKKAEAPPVAADSTSAAGAIPPPEVAPPASDFTSGWVEAPQEIQRMTLGSKFSGRVGDLDEAEADDGAQLADLEAEEAKYV